jgi:GR25 family glycosyltransferase involved in LPS biosynthesis
MMSNKISIFCLSHNNLKRRERLKRVFSERGLEARFYDGVGPDDPRISGRPLRPNVQRAWSIMYGHLDMLQLFLEAGTPFGIFCEDDILIRRDFGVHLPQILEHFKELKLDVLLLGNLCSNPNFRFCSNFPEMVTSSLSMLSAPSEPFQSAPKEPYPFKYYAYDSNPESAVWGTQMYMLHRDQAQFLVQKYANGYSDATLSDKSLVHFSADWTITKEGTKAIIYPLVAIESYETEYADAGQDACRKACHKLFYSEKVFE